MKTLGQIAHDAGKFDRQWHHMGESQKEDWERIAQAVIDAQQVAVPAPMTEDEAKNLLKTSDLLDMFENIGWYSAPRKSFSEHALSLIRAIEQHHKIGAKK